MEGIDVVIPTGKNIEESHYSICYTIRSIISQKLQPNQILVVVNAPDTGVEIVLDEQFGKLVRVIDGFDKGPNISYARNTGAQNGCSDIILFMDDDVILGYHDYFTRIQEILKYNDFCCGAIRYWTSSDWYKYLSLDYSMNHNLQILRVKSYLPLSIDRNTGNRKMSEYTYIGNLGAIKRDVFEKIGRFDEVYEGWQYQDTDLMMRLCYNSFSYEVLSYSNMFCFHLGHAADKSLYQANNRERYMNKQAELGIQFCLSNFFGRFDDNEATFDVIKTTISD